MLVAFPPGGADDAIARIIQDAVQKALGQPIVIENIGGAGGTARRRKAARAEPDGYTILLHQDALAAGMTLYPNRTFDAEKDFVTDRSHQYRRDHPRSTSDAASQQSSTSCCPG